MTGNNKSYNTVKTDILIYIMGVIGIIFSIGGLGAGLAGTVMLFLIPMILCIMYMIFKHPVYGIFYTFLFVYNRSNIFFEMQGNMLAYIFGLAIVAFFADVSYRSYAKWKEINRSCEINISMLEKN